MAEVSFLFHSLRTDLASFHSYLHDEFTSAATLGFLRDPSIIAALLCNSCFTVRLPESVIAYNIYSFLPNHPALAKILVSGAGSDIYNGYFKETYAFRGKPKFTKINADSTVFMNSEGRNVNIYWSSIVASWSFGNDGWFLDYVAKQTTDTPPTNGWECYYNFGGKTPAPTLKYV